MNKSVSFVTTVHNRLWQLKQTLPANIKEVRGREADIVILAFNDSTVKPYIEDTYPEEVIDGLIKIFEYNGPEEFSCGLAKNKAHALATGEILFNLDADNFICNAFYHLQSLKENEILKNIPSDDGREGRIGLYKRLYNKTIGYQDEGSNQDGALVLRCTKAVRGVMVKLVDVKTAPISNTQTVL